VSVGRGLLVGTLPVLGTVRAVVADRGERGLAKMVARDHIALDILFARLRVVADVRRPVSIVEQPRNRRARSRDQPGSAGCFLALPCALEDPEGDRLHHPGDVVSEG